MSKIVRGFGPKDEQTRSLIIRHEVSDDVVYLENQKLKAKVSFENVSIRYHTEENIKGRPYLFFEMGHVASVYSNEDFIFDVKELKFTEESAPDLDVEWELNDQELLALIPKGILGFNYDIDSSVEDYLKPKYRLTVPIAFIKAQWSDIPITVNVYGIEAKNSKGLDVPVIGISEIQDHFGLKTNSYVTGYERIDNYFDDPDFYEKGYDKAIQDRFAAVEINNAIGLGDVYDPFVFEDKRQEEDKSKTSKVLTPHVLSEEEKIEMEKIAMLEYERDSLIEAKLDERKLERQIIDDSAIDVPEDLYADGSAQSAEPEDDQYLRFDDNDESEVSAVELSDEELAEYLGSSAESEDQRNARLKISQIQAANEAESAINEAAIQRVVDAGSDFISLTDEKDGMESGM